MTAELNVIELTSFNVYRQGRSSGLKMIRHFSAEVVQVSLYCWDFELTW